MNVLKDFEVNNNKNQFNKEFKDFKIVVVVLLLLFFYNFKCQVI